MYIHVQLKQSVVVFFDQVQSPVKAFPTSAKITGFDTSPKDPYPVMFHLFKAR